jgi:PKD repeat protein
VGEIDCKADFTYSVDPSLLEVSFTDNSLGNATDYFWYFDDGDFGVGENLTHTYTKGGLYDVSLSISDAAGLCTDITNQPIQVGTIDCDADFSIYVDSISNTAYFTSNLVGDATDFFWIFGDGEYSGELNPSHQYTAPGFYKVALSTYNASNGCMDTKEQVLLIGSQGLDCEADFFYQVNNLEVSFFDKSYGEDLSYSWQFGDMDTSNLQNPTHTYTAGRFYNVCLTITTADGISNTTCKIVKVTPDPRRNCKADFIFTVDSTSNTVIFKDKSLGKPDNWLWRFGDGLSETDTNPEHTYDTAGLYKVSLLIENSTNYCRSKQIKLLDLGSSVHGMKTAFEYEKDSSLFKSSGYPVDFIGLSTGDPATYAWNFGDGSGIIHTTSTPTHIYSQAGTYTTCLTIEDPVTQQSSTSCDDITVGGTQPVGIDEISEMANKITINSVPNPFTTYTEISYEIPMDTEIEIIIMDIAGNKIETLIKTYKQKGEHSIIWDAYQAKSGMYLIQLKTTEGVYKHKMVVKR